MLQKEDYTNIIDPQQAAWEIFFPCTHNKTKELPHSAPLEWTEIFSKAYARMPIMSLPPPALPNKSLKKVLEERYSERNFTKKGKMTLTQLSTLLHYSVGINGERRFYPSAGARYPVETYVLANSVQGLSRKIYHYYAKKHILEDLGKYDLQDLKDTFVYDFTSKAHCLILLTGIFPRTTMKYQNRGYNYTFIEAGHIGQNLSLISPAIKLGCCAIGGFIEKNMNTLLNVNPRQESVIYAFALSSK